jgi:hypothetical protein
MAIAQYIAAGGTELADASRARFLAEARRSAAQCSALLDVSRSLKLADEEAYASGRGHLLQIVSQLSRLERALQGFTGAGTEQD